MNILVFAGTTEGRVLIEELLNIEKVFVCACVATEYGKEILEHEPAENLEIKAGRLIPEEMQKLMLRGFDWVIDATHPYATVVTENIKQACDKTNSRYIRLLRDKTVFGTDCVFVESTEAAVEYLNNTKGNVLLTTGSKELVKYTEVDNCRERLYARVLPMEQVLKSCNELGFSGKHLICMQGPFSCELNRAMLMQLDCSYMVTKDTGKEGGAYEKYQAAKAAGATLIVVGRTEQEEGMSLQQVIKEINIETLNKNIIINNEENGNELIRNKENGNAIIKNEMVRNKENENAISRNNQIRDVILSDEIDININKNKPDGNLTESIFAQWFPVFVNINDRDITVVGAGKIASRRIKTLLKFSCNLRIVAKDISGEIKQLAEEYIYINEKQGLNRTIELMEKEFDIEDIRGTDIVLAATNNREINQSIGVLCRERGILVNVADCKNECDFYFPGVVMHGDLIVGITAQGKSHSLAKKGSEAIRNAVKDIK